MCTHTICTSDAVHHFLRLGVFFGFFPARGSSSTDSLRYDANDDVAADADADGELCRVVLGHIIRETAVTFCIKLNSIAGVMVVVVICCRPLLLAEYNQPTIIDNARQNERLANI